MTALLISGLDCSSLSQVALAGKDNSISLSFSSFNNLGDLMTAESQVMEHSARRLRDSVDCQRMKD